jgi:hypothetical protein
MTVSTMAERRSTKSASERANHRLLLISGAIGGVIGLVLALSVLTGHHDDATVGQAMVSGPIPAWLAIAIALIWGVLMPIISIRWERVVDEHEREAYRDGAVAGFYVIGCGAPVWWFLWRGGLVPPVDSALLYAAVLIVTGAVWLWRKYR